jgi:hypothetical protein
MKKLISIFLILSLAINLFLLYFFLVKGETHPIKNDTRSAIITTYTDKEFVMSEMRGFLETIKEINEGIANNLPEKIIKAAEKSGGAATEHAPAGLLKVLPLSFKKLGFDTHDRFDEIAKLAKENYNRDQIQQKMSEVLNNCTSCHQSYKFEVKP